MISAAKGVIFGVFMGVSFLCGAMVMDNISADNPVPTYTPAYIYEHTCDAGEYLMAKQEVGRDVNDEPIYLNVIIGTPECCLRKKIPVSQGEGTP